MLTNADLLEIGFEEIPHFTIGNAVTYDLGRDRYLSASNVGDPCEMVFLTQRDSDDPKKVTDAVVLHNWDFDGYLTREKITSLIQLIKGGKK